MRIKEAILILKVTVLLMTSAVSQNVFGDQKCKRSLFTDLKWINTQSTEEACKILKIGNKNRSFACTRMNEQSSRRFVPLFIRILCLSSFKDGEAGKGGENFRISVK